MAIEDTMKKIEKDYGMFSHYAKGNDGNYLKDDNGNLIVVSQSYDFEYDYVGDADQLVYY